MTSYPKNWFSLTNDTPYTMTKIFQDSWWFDMYNHRIDPATFAVEPAQIILPGQKMAFEFDEAAWPNGWMAINLHYQFADVDGRKHRCDFNVDTNNNVTTYSLDIGPDGSVNNPDGVAAAVAGFSHGLRPRR